MRGVTHVGLERSGYAGTASGIRMAALVGGDRPVRGGKLGEVGRPQSEGAGSRGPRGPVWWATLAVLLAAAVLAAIVAAGGAPAAAGAVVLAGGAALVGWRAGESHRGRLEREIEDRSNALRGALSELEVAQAETVQRLSMAVEFRDEDTGAHIERIGRFSTLLAEQIGMDEEFCTRISHAAPLHDVGKVAIPDAILLKPGPLTAEERSIVETHAEEGHRLLRGSSSSILDLAASIALSHHEKWDGSGYPRGLVGETIPMEGRIVAIADVFDALTSDRVYRGAYSVEEAVELMLEQRGRHFDPVLLDAFMEVLGRSGADAREQLRSDPQALVAEVLQTFSTALERGDAETAEGAIAQAIEDGITPASLHAEVIGPALRHVSRQWEAGEIDTDIERLATGITRRILATMFRYMLGGTEPTRERVLLAGVEDDEHTLELQMVHDQLAAAGYQTTLATDLSSERLEGVIESQSPELIVLGATISSAGPLLDRLVSWLRESHPEIPVLLGGAAARGPRLPDDGVRVLGRLDESVPVAEELLAARAHALG